MENKTWTYAQWHREFMLSIAAVAFAGALVGSMLGFVLWEAARWAGLPNG